MACQSCGKPSDTCGTVLPDTCINYVGSMEDFPCITVPNGFCVNSVHDVLTLFGNTICDLSSKIDLSDLTPRCLTLTPPYTINTTLQQLIDQFCPIITEVNTIYTELQNILTIHFPTDQLTWGSCFSFGPCDDDSEMVTLLLVLNKIIEQVCSNTSGACKVSISATDGCCDYLGQKIVAGNNITIQTISNGVCDQLRISAPDPTPALTVQNGYEVPTEQVNNVSTLIANGFRINAGSNPGEAILKQRVSIFLATPEVIPAAGKAPAKFTLTSNTDAKVMHGSSYVPGPAVGIWHPAVFNAYTQNDANITYNDNDGTFYVNESGFYNISGLVTLRPGGGSIGNPGAARWGGPGWIKVGLTQFGTGNEYVSTITSILDNIDGGNLITQGATTINFSRFCLELQVGDKIEFRILNATANTYLDHNNPTAVGSSGQDIMQIAFVKLFDAIP